MIRQVTDSDIGRIAEIIVYNNRKNFYPIFQDIKYSFEEFNVFSVAEQFRADTDFMQNTFVYEDEVIKGFICVVEGEIKKLYVDSFFQSEGIGGKLIQFAIEDLNASSLWALEKNVGALRFYKKHGFHMDGAKEYEEGTTEFLVHMVRYA